MVASCTATRGPCHLPGRLLPIFPGMQLDWSLLSWESRRVATAQGDGGSRPGIPPWEPMDTLTHQPEMQKQAQWLQIRTGSHGVEWAEQEVA